MRAEVKEPRVKRALAAQTLCMTQRAEEEAAEPLDSGLEVDPHKK